MFFEKASDHYKRQKLNKFDVNVLQCDSNLGLKYDRVGHFLCLSFSSLFVLSKEQLLFPQQKARGILTTDTAKKAFQEEEVEEGVRRFSKKQNLHVFAVCCFI